MNRSYIKNLKFYLLSDKDPLTVLSLCIEKNFHSKKVYKIIVSKVLSNRNDNSEYNGYQSKEYNEYKSKQYKSKENICNAPLTTTSLTNKSNISPIVNTYPTTTHHTPLISTLIIVSKNIENPFFYKKFPLQYTLSYILTSIEITPYLYTYLTPLLPYYIPSSLQLYSPSYLSYSSLISLHFYNFYIYTNLFLLNPYLRANYSDEGDIDYRVSNKYINTPLLAIPPLPLITDESLPLITHLLTKLVITHSKNKEEINNLFINKELLRNILISNNTLPYRNVLLSILYLTDTVTQEEVDSYICYCDLHFSYDSFFKEYNSKPLYLDIGVINSNNSKIPETNPTPNHITNPTLTLNTCINNSTTTTPFSPLLPYINPLQIVNPNLHNYTPLFLCYTISYPYSYCIKCNTPLNNLIIFFNTHKTYYTNKIRGNNIEGVSSNTNNLHPFNNSTDNLHPFNNSSNDLHPLPNPSLTLNTCINNSHIIHNIIHSAITPDILTTLLHSTYTYNTPLNIYTNIKINKEIEHLFIEVLKYIDSTYNISMFITTLHIVSNLTFTDKIAFSSFVVIYNGLSKHGCYTEEGDVNNRGSKQQGVSNSTNKQQGVNTSTNQPHINIPLCNNTYLTIVVKYTFSKRRNSYIKILDMILEYILIIKAPLYTIDNIFNKICYLLDITVEEFIKEYMYIIAPVIYKHIIRPVSNKDSYYRGANNSTSEQTGVNNSINGQHPFNYNTNNNTPVTASTTNLNTNTPLYDILNKNIHFILSYYLVNNIPVTYILNKHISKIIKHHKIDLLLLLITNNTDYYILYNYIDISNVIYNNISVILFKSKMYCNKGVCIYCLMRVILGHVVYRLEVLFNQVFPYLECYSNERGCGCYYRIYYKEISGNDIEHVRGSNNGDVSEEGSKQQGVSDKGSKQQGVNDTTNSYKGVGDKGSKQQGFNDRTNSYKGVSDNSGKQQGFNNLTSEQQGVNNNASNICRSLFFGWLYTQCSKHAPYSLKNVYPYLDIKYLVSDNNSVNECIFIMYELLRGIESRTVGVVMSKVKSIFLFILKRCKNSVYGNNTSYYTRYDNNTSSATSSGNKTSYFTSDSNNTPYYTSIDNNTSYATSSGNKTSLNNNTVIDPPLVSKTTNNSPLSNTDVTNTHHTTFSSLIISFISVYSNNTPLQRIIYKIYIRVLEVYNIYKNADCSYILVIMGSIGIKGVNNNSSGHKNIKGVSDKGYVLEGVNKCTYKQQGLSNSTNKQHPFTQANLRISLPKDCSINNTCKYLLENILLLQNYKEQDILFFAIQQTLKTMTDINILEKCIIDRIIHFKDTHYFIPTTDSNKGFYSKDNGITPFNSTSHTNLGNKGCYYKDISKVPFNDTIPNLLNIILSLLYNNTLYSYYNLLSYGTLLNPNISMFYTFIGIKVLYNNGLLQDSSRGVSNRDMLEGVNNSIINYNTISNNNSTINTLIDFLYNMSFSLDRKVVKYIGLMNYVLGINFIDNSIVYRCCNTIDDVYGVIRIVETIIRENKEGTDYKGVIVEKRDYKGVGDKDSNIMGVRYSTGIFKGVNDTTGNYKGVSNNTGNLNTNNNTPVTTSSPFYDKLAFLYFKIQDYYSLKGVSNMININMKMFYDLCLERKYLCAYKVLKYVKDSNLQSDIEDISKELEKWSNISNKGGVKYKDFLIGGVNDSTDILHPVNDSADILHPVINRTFNTGLINSTFNTGLINSTFNTSFNTDTFYSKELLHLIGDIHILNETKDITPLITRRSLDSNNPILIDYTINLLSRNKNLLSDNNKCYSKGSIKGVSNNTSTPFNVITTPPNSYTAYLSYLKVLRLKHLRLNKQYDLFNEEVVDELLNNNFIVLYEQSKYYLTFNRRSKALECINRLIGILEGVNDKDGFYKDIMGVSNKDNIYEDIKGFNYMDSKQQGVSKGSNKQRGVSEITDNQQGVNNTNNLHPFSNSTGKQQGFNNNNAIYYNKSVLLQTKIKQDTILWNNVHKRMLNSEKMFYLKGKYFYVISPFISLQSYIESVKYGNKYVYETIPVILHIYCEILTEGISDTGVEGVNTNASNIKGVNTNTSNIKGVNTNTSNIKGVNKNTPNIKGVNNNTLITNTLYTFFTDTPISHFLPFYSQILSKLSHTDISIVNNISLLLVRMLNDLPYKCVYNTLISINSTNTDVRKRIDSILKGVNPLCKKVLYDVGVLSKYFVSIGKLKRENIINRCAKGISDLKGVNEKGSNIKGVSITTNKQQGVSDILNEQGVNNNTTNLTINTYPANTYSLLKVFPYINTIFPLEAVIPNRKCNIKIAGVKDSIYIYNSLQCPKRIELIGENGKTYSIMCKSKDDLRKDKRFMELNELLNTILARDIRNNRSSSSINNISSFINSTDTNHYTYIRTYNVVPIDSSNGILEIVGNLRSFRNICEEYLKERGVVLAMIMNKYRSKKKVGIEDFRDVCKEVGKVFYKFIEECTDNYEWYLRLKNYTISYSVMAIVGYFMGLGDRHGENILLDTKTGEAVHVDLSCIFDNGKLLEIKEVVPFRLTQNIISGFGCCGVEGLFRRTMEDVMRCLVSNKELIVSNLLGFVYDPLFEWSRRGVSNKGCNDVISVLFDKLKIKDVNERVNELIEEACDDVNLASMYIGWCSFL